MTEPDSLVFRRLLVPLGPSGADAAILRAAADFALLLSLDLHGVFVEDEALLIFAGLPFAREIRLPTHDWRPLAAERLAEELRHAAQQARRLLEETLASRAMTGAFAVLRGDPFGAVAALCTGSDIVVLGAPGLAGWQAQCVPRAILVLPKDAPLRGGAVAVVLGDASDPALEVGCRIAAASGRDLLLLLPGGPESVRQAAGRVAEFGIEPQRIETRALADVSERSILDALGTGKECLIVLGPNAGLAAAEAAARIGAARETPVLAMNPGNDDSGMPEPRRPPLATRSGDPDIPEGAGPKLPC